MPSQKLHIADDLKLPIDAATSTIVIYGGKGMGKTNLATVLVEEFAHAGVRFAVIDPMGVWWGLRHSADGKGPGIKVLILGGIHGDLPITPESGALVADLVVDEDASVVIDISRRADGSMWAIAERIRFVRDYVKRIYQRQGEKRRPLNQVIDEAARFAPQIVRQGESDVAACMGAIAVLVEEGRNVGIGTTLVTQRSARLNKDVAELADCMIAFRIVGPNSMRAVLDWLGEHVEKSRLKDIGEKLRSLPRGSALVVSPGWLEFEGIVAMRKRETFDSSDTPKTGGSVRVGAGTKLDLTKYRERLAELVESQKANDPKTLKATIAALEKEVVAAKRAGPVTEKVVENAIEKPVVDKATALAFERSIASGTKLAERFYTASERHEAIAKQLLDCGTKLAQQCAAIAAKLAEFSKPAPAFRHPPMTVPPPRERAAMVMPPAVTMIHDLDAGHGARSATAQKPPARPAANGTANGASPGGGLRRMLVALAQRPQGLTGRQIGIRAGLSSRSGTFSNYLSQGRKSGWIADMGSIKVITPEGIQALGDYDPLPTGRALADYWLRELGQSGAARILRALLDAYPDRLTDGQIGERAEISPKSGTYSNYLSKLRGLELIDDQRGSRAASEELFA
jgi:uncharacterized protein